MNKVFLSVLVGLFCAGFALSQNLSKYVDALITEDGWGEIKVGMPVSEIENILGKPDAFEEVLDSIFVNYDLYDVVIIGIAKTKKVGAIRFAYLEKTRMSVKTDKGINRDSTEEDVLKSYGEPKKITENQIERKLYYEGICFVFRKYYRERKLFSILVHDKKENKFL